MPDASIRRRVIVHGRVQGVFFRDSTRRRAESRGVAGWVTNRPDGAVEAVFEGDPDAVESMMRFVREARDSGHSCIFIAHNIHHVFQVVDRIVVMRRGRVVADAIDPKQSSIEEVERIITGMSDEEVRAAVV